MAVGNRQAYSSVAKSTYKILCTLRDIIRPDLRGGDTERVSDDVQRLMDKWREMFGDPEEAERKLLEQSKKAAAATNDNTTQDYIRNQLFR
jgi:hypothetical protein